MAKIPGIDFDFGTETLTIPPLALGDLEVLQKRLGGLEVGAVDPASVAAVIDVTLAALLRNYPDMTRERVARLIDVANMAEVTRCVMDVAGLHRKEIEQGKARAGQAQTPG